MPDRRVVGLIVAGLVLPFAAGGAEPAADREGVVAVLLARPLFTPGRRSPSPPVAAAAPAVRETLPRLTGIMVAGPTRRALFAAQGARPTSVAEGERIGSYRVTSITERQVGLASASGADVFLLPSADAAMRSDLVYVAPPVALIEPQRRERETENDQ